LKTREKKPLNSFTDRDSNSKARRVRWNKEISHHKPMRGGKKLKKEKKSRAPKNTGQETITPCKKGFTSVRSSAGQGGKIQREKGKKKPARSTFKTGGHDKTS